MQRYVVVSLDKAVASGWIDEAYDADVRSGIFDTASDPPREVFSDGGAPEDQVLWRDLSVFPALLNEQEAELAKLRERVAELEAPPVVPEGWRIFLDNSGKWVGDGIDHWDAQPKPNVLRALAWAIEHDQRPPHASDRKEGGE